MKNVFKGLAVARRLSTPSSTKMPDIVYTNSPVISRYSRKRSENLCNAI